MSANDQENLPISSDISFDMEPHGFFSQLINLGKNCKNVKQLKINRTKDKYQNYQRPGLGSPPPKEEKYQGDSSL